MARTRLKPKHRRPTLAVEDPYAFFIAEGKRATPAAELVEILTASLPGWRAEAWIIKGHGEYIEHLCAKYGVQEGTR